VLLLVIADAGERRVMDRYQGNSRHVVAVVVGEAPEDVGPVAGDNGHGRRDHVPFDGGQPGLMEDYLDYARLTGDDVDYLGRSRSQLAGATQRRRCPFEPLHQ